MRCIALFAATLLLAVVRLCAETSAARLLPPDTVTLLCIPDWDKTLAAARQSAPGKLWQDRALKPFKERLRERCHEDLANPLEHQLGIKFADFFELAHGQITVAFLANGWGNHADANPGILLLVDTKDQQETLKTRLAELTKKWVEAGKQLKTDKVRDVDCTTLMIPADELTKTLEKVLPPPPDQEEEDAKPETRKKAAKTEISFCQSGSLLIVANTLSAIEAVLTRQAGDLAPTLAEQAGFRSGNGAAFGDALAYGWVNFARVYQTSEKKSGTRSKSESPLALRPGKLLSALGLGALSTISARLTSDSEGIFADVVLSVPELRRQGILKLLSLPKKDAAPPSFIGADTVKFSRWRVDGPKAWSLAENVVATIAPELAGLLQMGLEVAGKERDPNFDLKQTLLGSLGNDFISVTKNPRSSGLGDLNAPPTLFLLGSGSPDHLVQAMKAATALMPVAGGEVDLKEREFLGRKIYSLALPSLGGPEEAQLKPSQRSFHFAGSGSSGAMSTDLPMIEEFLRSTESSGKVLRDLPGLNEAAQKVGGMSTGVFGYNNQVDSIRAWVESAKKESAAIDKLLALSPVAGGKVITPEERKNMKEMLDFSLLPSFDKLAKYFHFVVYSLSSNDQAITWKFFAPVPPQLK